MVNNGQKTVFIKLVRSGIGFSHKQKRQIHSLGFSRLNQVVERPDTPQIRGLVNSIPHLAKIVKQPVMAAWASTPEYSIRPPGNAPATSVQTGEELSKSPAHSEDRGEAPVIAAGEDKQEDEAPTPRPDLAEAEAVKAKGTELAGQKASGKKRADREAAKSVEESEG